MQPAYDHDPVPTPSRTPGPTASSVLVVRHVTQPHDLASWLTGPDGARPAIIARTPAQPGGDDRALLTRVEADDHASLVGVVDAAVLVEGADAAAELAPALAAGAGLVGGSSQSRATALAGATLLGRELQGSLETLAIATGAIGAGLWFHGQGGAEPHGAELGLMDLLGGAERGRTVAALGVPVVMCADDVFTMIAVAVSPAGANPGAVLALAWRGVQLIDGALDAELRALTARFAGEARVLVVQERLLAEHERLRETAMLDGVTGAWNRAAFERATLVEISAAGRRGEPLALVLFDVVGLSRINDRLGHRAGDAALAHVASVIRANVRVTDEIGRVGDDEIALLLVAADVARSVPVAEKLLRRITERPALHDGVEIPVTVRVGVTEIRPGDRTFAPLLGRAAAAMAHVRPSGGVVAYATQEHRGEASTIAATRGDAALFELPAGTIGGAYRVLHELSRGATGVVYRGEDIALGRPVAIKVLRTDLGRNRPLVERFRREAQVLASLRHANLVQVYNFGVQGDDVYLVMELVEGPTLGDLVNDHVARHESLDLEAATEVINEVADALDTMHAAGVVHRDVKPDNIIIDRIGERAVLVDVGAAKRTGERVAGAGTPGFAAPESFADGEEGLATDVYGLAATAYTLLTGRLPHGHGDALAVLSRQLDAPPPPPSALRRGIPVAVDEVLLRALSVEPTQRYGSAGAFALALTRAMSTSGRHAVPRGALTRLTIDGELVVSSTAPAPSDQLGQVRGAAFRVAAKVLGHRRGEPWLRRVAETDLSLAYVLRPTLAPASWQRLDKLVELIGLATDGDDQLELARTIGRGLVSATFAALFGAATGELDANVVLAALPSVWGEYLDRGRIELIQCFGGTARYRLVDGVADRRAVEMVCGMLQRVVESTGADDVEVVATAGDTADELVFDLGWSMQVE
ncbi:MAG: diguanylate cyclase [Kofleriaceae bacterium]|nr:diguanylate cyclase [Kofleriaceae bacterium]